MSGCEGYHALARFYDKLNAEIDYAAWADFVERCFENLLEVEKQICDKEYVEGKVHRFYFVMKK